MWRGSLLIAGIWLVFSCNEIKECDLDTSTDYAIARFYRSDTVVQTAKSDTVQYIKSPASEFNLYSDTVLSAIVLPLFSEAEQITYNFMLDSINYDLTLFYTPHLRIYYYDCDPVYSYQLDSVYSTTFDSVAIFNGKVDINVSSNVELYF